MKKNSLSILILLIIISVAAGIFSYPPLWNKISDAKPWSLGLDISGGSYLVYEIDLTDVSGEDHDSVVTGLRDVIERRVNLFGVSEPQVYNQEVDGNERLVVELAGVKDVSKAIDEIGETPILDFREVETATTTSSSPGATAEFSTEDSTSTATTSIGGTQGTTSPRGQNYNFKKTDLTGRYVKGAQVGFEQVTGQPQVNIEFTEEGAMIFEELTGENVGEPIAIFLDNNLVEMPTVQQKIVGGRAQITGEFTLDEANQLVQRFNAGALPAPIKLVNQNTVSPELGADSLHKSIKAGLWGLLAVLLFMIAYYRKLGIFASGALLMYVALVLGIFKVIPITLTLSGIAAIILSIGMAVDANILVFERLQEELDRGLDFSSAVEEGFRRAWTSIRDANITTIISAAVLFYITTGFVKGFALALIIGVVLSMFSAITITRTMLRVYYQNKEK